MLMVCAPLAFAIPKGAAVFLAVMLLVLFLLLMGMLIVAFIKVAHDAKDTQRGQVAIAGTCIVASYLVFCSTSSFFAAQSATSFFVFFVGLLLGICYRSDRTHAGLGARAP